MPKVPAFDWTQFRVGIYIRALPLDIFAMWTEAEQLCRWFLRSAAFAPSEGPPADRRARAALPAFDTLTPRRENETCRTNDRYRWEWYYDGGIVGEEWVREVRPPTRLGFGFGEEMEVEVSLRKQGKSCEVNLRQYNIPTGPRARRELHMGCRIAWAFFLTNLKSVSEGGLDLRETERARVSQLHLVNM